MTGRPRTAFAPGSARKVWRTLLMAAQAHEPGRPAPSRIEAATYVGLVVSTAKVRFPLEHAAAQDAAAAFITIAKRYVTTAPCAARDGLARFMVAGATCLEAMLETATGEAAEAWKRQTPGDWD